MGALHSWCLLVENLSAGSTGWLCLIIYPTISLLTHSYTVDWRGIKRLIKMLKSFRGLSWSRTCPYDAYKHSRLACWMVWNQIWVFLYWLIRVQWQGELNVFTVDWIIMLPRSIDLLVWVTESVCVCVLSWFPLKVKQHGLFMCQYKNIRLFLMMLKTPWNCSMSLVFCRPHMFSIETWGFCGTIWRACPISHQYLLSPFSLYSQSS